MKTREERFLANEYGELLGREGFEYRYRERIYVVKGEAEVAVRVWFDEKHEMARSAWEGWGWGLLGGMRGGDPMSLVKWLERRLKGGMKRGN